MASPQFETEPDRVVATVLAACRRSAAAGAAELWRLAGERLRRSAGDPAHLARLLGNDLFRPLIEHRRAEPAAPDRLDDAARQRVVLEGKDGERVEFLFSLALARHGERRGRWLVTGIERT